MVPIVSLEGRTGKIETRHADNNPHWLAISDLIDIARQLCHSYLK
jgi:hypothetical protein